ncbi:MAG: hypothetical protein J5795_01475 [Lachnospiraceae bacterium]|nr:hypothetical protein [Lachnospiraceae bacterium]
MFALYKGKVYQASNFMGRWYLATDRQESEALGFVRRTPSRYYLALKNLSEVDELYDVQAYVSFNTGMEGVPTEWEISPAFDTVQEGCIKLWHVGDRIPGWISPEPAVWFRYIPFNEIEKAWIVKTDAKTKESTYAEVDTADLKVLCNVEALGELAQKYIRKKAE